MSENLTAAAETLLKPLAPDGASASAANGTSLINEQKASITRPEEPIVLPGAAAVPSETPVAADEARPEELRAPQSVRPNKFQELLARSIEARLRLRWEEAAGELALLGMTPEERESAFRAWEARHRPLVDMKEERRMLLRLKRSRVKEKKKEGDYLQILKSKNVDLTPFEDFFAHECEKDPRVRLRKDLWNNFLRASDVGRGALLPLSQALRFTGLSDKIASISLAGDKGRTGVITLSISGRVVVRHGTPGVTWIGEHVIPVIVFSIRTWFSGWRRFHCRPRTQMFTYPLVSWIKLTTTAQFCDTDKVGRAVEPMKLERVIEALKDRESEELSTSFEVRRSGTHDHLRFVVRTSMPYVGVKYVDDCDASPELWGVLGEDVHKLFLPWIPHPGFAPAPRAASSS